MFYMDAIPKSNIKSVIKSDISIKPTTWIGQQFQIRQCAKDIYSPSPKFSEEEILSFPKIVLPQEKLRQRN